MDSHSYAGCPRFLEGPRRTHKLVTVGYYKAKIYHSPNDHAPNCLIHVTVGTLEILYTESDPNVKIGTNLVPSRHPIPVTVGTFEILKG